MPTSWTFNDLCEEIERKTQRDLNEYPLAVEWLENAIDTGASKAGTSVGSLRILQLRSSKVITITSGAASAEDSADLFNVSRDGTLSVRIDDTNEARTPYFKYLEPDDYFKEVNIANTVNARFWTIDEQSRILCTINDDIRFHYYRKLTSSERMSTLISEKPDDWKTQAVENPAIEANRLLYSSGIAAYIFDEIRDTEETSRNFMDYKSLVETLNLANSFIRQQINTRGAMNVPMPYNRRRRGY